jgi:hypothetical protein
MAKKNLIALLVLTLGGCATVTTSRPQRGSVRVVDAPRLVFEGPASGHVNESMDHPLTLYVVPKVAGTDADCDSLGPVVTNPHFVRLRSGEVLCADVSTGAREVLFSFRSVR